MREIFTIVAAVVLSAGSLFAAAPGTGRSGEKCPPGSAGCASGRAAAIAGGPDRDCAKTVVVDGMHYPDLTCAQSKDDFMGSLLTSYHFTSKCPEASLLAVYDVSCQDMPLHGFSSGSVYKGTACCGKVPPAKACERIKDPKVCVATACKDSGRKCVLTAEAKCACAPRLPDRKCARAVAVSGLHDPDATTCALRLPYFLEQIAQQVRAWDKPGTFSSLCQPGLRLLSAYDITCVPAPLSNYPGGSLYGATACCGEK